MTINEFLECFNDTIQQERSKRGIESLGHFVFYTWCDKKPIGNYYDCKMRLEYVHTIGVINPFVSLDKVIQASNWKEDKEKELEPLYKAILTSFLTKVLQPDVYNSIVENTYGTD